MLLQRIVFINKLGDTVDMVLEIIGKKSKNIITRQPDDGAILIIPRKDVEVIRDIDKEKPGC